MKSHVFLASLGVGVAAVAVGQMMAVGGGEPDGTNVYDIASACGLSSLQQVGSLGTYPTGSVGLAMLTVGQNHGNVMIPWYASPSMDHPVIAQNMYRVTQDGRLEQIGQAWLKHAWFALQQSLCSSACQSGGNGQNLGINCADTYSAGNNSDQSDLGPRWEVFPDDNRWMNGISWAGSHFAAGQGHSNGVMHRMRVRMEDLTTAGAQYYYEAQYAMLRRHDGVRYPDLVELPEHMLNNARHRRTNVTRNGNSFTFSNAATDVNGPLVQAWGDVKSRADQTDDGIVYVSSRVVDLGGGQHRYEYAVMNYTFDRELGALSIPVGNAIISDIGFHAPVDGYWDAGGNFVNESNYDTSAWMPSLNGGTLTFAPPSAPGTMEQNSIRWSTVYTFWFTANAGPGAGTQDVTITPHRAGGTVNSLTAAVRAPVTTETSVPMTDIAKSFGTFLSGDMAAVSFSDNTRFRVRSSFGFTSAEPNVAEIRAGFASPVQNPAGLRIVVEGSIDQTGGTRKVRLRNFDAGGIVQVDSYAVGTADVLRVTDVTGGAGQYVRNTDGRIELIERTSVVLVFSSAGFVDRHDTIRLGLLP